MKHLVRALKLIFATLRLMLYSVFLKEANKSRSVITYMNGKLKQSKTKGKCPHIYEEEMGTGTQLFRSWSPWGFML